MSTKPEGNDIGVFFHCKSCIDIRPINMSPREWVALEVGWTKKGLQVWCTRCEKNIINIDLLGQKVATMALAISLSLPSIYSWDIGGNINTGAPLDFNVGAHFKLFSF